VTKLISVSEEAYSRLAKLKGKEKSFTEIIIELTEKKKSDFMEFFGALKMNKNEIKKLKSKLKKERKTMFVR
jgi:predicted CopG family antitoxin